MDIKLDTSGDIDLAAGALVLVDGDEAVIQRIRIRLQVFRGEWYADRSQGVPYYERILLKNPDSRVVQAIFTAAIVGVAGVVEVTEMTYTLGTDRVLALSFVARLESGRVVRSSDFGPFLVGF